MPEPLDTLTTILAKQDDHLARQDEILATMDRHLVQQDAYMARMDDHLARQDEILAQLMTLTDIARQEATAAHQAMAVALTRYAETRLDVDRFIATAERVLAAWERHAGAS
jgi:uncharacterized coiled-coil protein SlyX